MKRIFDMDGPFARTLSAAADLVVLNLLTLLCCLPVVTAGAAVTALYDRVIHLVRGEDGRIVRPFFRSFAGNFRQGTIFWLLLLAAAAALALAGRGALTHASPLRHVVPAAAVLLLAFSQYVFALLSRYENSLGATLKNAALLAVGFFPRTAAMTAGAVLLWAVSLRFVRIGVPLLFLFGLSLPCYVSALLLRGVFAKLDNPGGDASADDDRNQEP